MLHGVDPLLLRSSGINSEIINVRLYKGIPLDSDQPIRERSGADVCVRTQATPNEETGEAIAREAASAIGLPFAYVHIRNDVWFIHQAFFPIDYRFEDAAPPSYKEYRESATLTCFVDAGESTCTLHRPPR